MITLNRSRQQIKGFTYFLKLIIFYLSIFSLFFPSGVVFAQSLPDTYSGISIQPKKLNTIVTITVINSDGVPIANTPVYVFSGTTYKKISARTDIFGHVSFSLPRGKYRFRADYNSVQFWSGTNNHCTLPGCTEAVVTVSKPVTISVKNTNGDPISGVPVYAFSGTIYKSLSATTNTNGQAILTLPFGDYRFRSDYNTTQFWSGATNHCTLPGCTETEITVSKPVTISVLDQYNLPIPNVNVYAFSNGNYSGFTGKTNSLGEISLTLPLNNYRFRVDYNSLKYWSDSTESCFIPGCESTSVFVTSNITPTFTSTPSPTNTEIPNTPTFTSTPSPTITEIPNTPTSTLTKTPIKPSATRRPTSTITKSLTMTLTKTPIIPSPTRTYTRTITRTPTKTFTKTPVTPSPTRTFTETSTPTITPTPSSTPSDTPTLTPTDTATLLPSDTPTPSETPTLTPTNTSIPSNTPTLTMPPVAGDDFDSPIDILMDGYDFSLSGDLSDASKATDDPILPCNAYDGGWNKTLWYRFIPPVSGSYIVDTLGTTRLYTDLAIWQGDRSTLTSIACGKGGISGPYPTSQIGMVSLTAGQIYYIEVKQGYSFMGKPYSFTLNVHYYPGFAGPGKYDDTYPGIIYGEYWHITNNFYNYYATHHYNYFSNSVSTFVFSGSGIKVIFPKRPECKTLTISIDGGAEVNIDQYSSTILREQEWISGPLVSGIHTLNFHQSTGEACLDAFEVLSIPPEPIFTEAPSPTSIPSPTATVTPEISNTPFLTDTPEMAIPTNTPEFTETPSPTTEFPVTETATAEPSQS